MANALDNISAMIDELVNCSVIIQIKIDARCSITLHTSNKKMHFSVRKIGYYAQFCFRDYNNKMLLYEHEPVPIGYRCEYTVQFVFTNILATFMQFILAEKYNKIVLFNVADTQQQ